MRQVLYVSVSHVGSDRSELDRIWAQSRYNNGLDGVTGALWSDGLHFAQVIEGTNEAVAATLQRIQADPRHSEIDLVNDRVVGGREFGDWSMIRPEGDDAGQALERSVIKRLQEIDTQLSDRFVLIVRGAASVRADDKLMS